MTDGIIQQIFTQYKIKYPTIPIYDLEQELIEKIKQEIQSDDDEVIRIVVKKLIGDMD